MANPEVAITLDEAVKQVLGGLTGLDLTYRAELDRYYAVTAQINRALRLHALEHEWSYYSDTEEVGVARAGVSEIALRGTVRPRIVSDDAVRLTRDGDVVVWAYFLPRDALHKYRWRGMLACAVTRSSLQFSRPFKHIEDGLTIEVPVMREPRMFHLPTQPENPDDPLVSVPSSVRQQLVDYDYPDAIILRAQYLYAQTDPVMQPRVQTLEAQFKDLMYQLIERDDRHTDSPYMNEFFVPVHNSIYGPSADEMLHGHPHSDERHGH